MPFRIIRNDITKVQADAIVNSADPEPKAGGGADGAVYDAAGRNKLLEERRKIGAIRPGEAAYTQAFALPARYIIHTVGPVWEGGTHGELQTLASCYEKSLALAEELGCTSVAFPLIGTGSFAIPKDQALKSALSVIGRYLLDHDMDITLVVYDPESFAVSKEEYSAVQEFIDENMFRERPLSNACHRRYAMPAKTDTFQERLLELIDRSGMTDAEVYKKANLDRKLFSKIRKDVNYHPSKETVIALALALELDIIEANDLLNRAGYAFSPADERDLTIESFFVRRIYDMTQLESILFARFGHTLKE